MLDDRDREKWLAVVERSARACRWLVFAFALMDNHFHLFLQTPEANLSRGMQRICGGYATWFNLRHRRAGHLFQGRFRAVLVEAEGHWLELSRYVHLNPVRAGLATTPEGWRWSSFRGYRRKGERLDWIDYGRVLGEFGGDTPSGTRAYSGFVSAGVGRVIESPLAAAVHGVVLGSEQFVERVRLMIEGRPSDREVPSLERLRGRPSLVEVIEATAKHFGADRSSWRTGSRSDDLVRAVAASLARDLTDSRLAEIAAALGYRSASSVSVACRRTERAKGDERLADDIVRLKRRIVTNH